MSIKSRIVKLESVNGGRKNILTMLLNASDNVLDAIFDSQSEWDQIHILLMAVNDAWVFSGKDDPFVLEKFRGRLPDELIRKTYNHMRNYGNPDEKAREKLLKKAGILDEDGNIQPGYKWNGDLINDADDAA